MFIPNAFCNSQTGHTRIGDNRAHNISNHPT